MLIPDYAIVGAWCLPTKGVGSLKRYLPVDLIGSHVSCRIAQVPRDTTRLNAKRSRGLLRTRLLSIFLMRYIKNVADKKLLADKI